MTNFKKQRVLSNLYFLSILFIAIFLSSCAGIVRSPVYGFFLTNTTGPVASAEKAAYSKVGMATCRSINVYFSVGWGDCTIEKAKDEAGITKVSFVDQESLQILGIYGEYTLMVYGD